MNYRNNPILVSPPVPVYFEGWESDTYRLSSRGWKIAVEEDIRYDRYTFLISNEILGLVGFSSNYDWYKLRNTIYEDSNGMQRYGGCPPIKISQLAKSLSVQHRMETSILSGFREIDATPEYMSFEEIKADNITCFKYKDSQKVDEIILEKADMSVIEHLEAIKRIQKPRQAELREKVRKLEVHKTDNVIQLLKVA